MIKNVSVEEEEDSYSPLNHVINETGRGSQSEQGNSGRIEETKCASSEKFSFWALAQYYFT